MTCTHRIAGDGPLVCVRTDDHDPTPNRGHIYYSTTALDAERQEADS